MGPTKSLHAQWEKTRAMNGENWQGLLPLFALILVIAAIWIHVRRKARKTSSPLSLPPAAPVAEYRGPLAFFRKHINGDYSLGRSYWINTLLITVFAPTVGILLLPWLARNFPARFSSAAILFLTLIGLLAWTWAASGTWASANKHVGRGGKAFWAAAAKVMIILGALNTIFDIYHMTPALKEHLMVALGSQLGPKTKLEVRADGRSILLYGGINDGAADKLERALRVAPAVKTVVLSSNGGWIREGRMLAEVIRRHHLDTYVEGYCASACTIAFLAGRDRAAAPNAKIGFHASRAIGDQSGKIVRQETLELLGIYRSAGLSDAFIRRVGSTPNSQMWYPTTEEMLTAGVLTRRSLGGETAAFATAAKSKEQIAVEFRKIDLFSALAKRSPETFEQVVEVAWQKAQQGATDAEVISVARAKLTRALPTYFPIATDETLMRYSTLIQKELEALRKKDVTACKEMLAPSGQPMKVVGNLPNDLAQSELKLMTILIRDADPRRAIKPSRQMAIEVMRPVIARMTKEQTQAFLGGQIRRAAPEVACDSGIAFFGAINSVPEPERGHALRVIFSAK